MDARPSERVLTKTVYLEMHAPSSQAVPAPAPDVRIDRFDAPSVDEYRRLYDGVGRDYHWVDRNLMADDALRRIVQDQRVEIYVLKVAGEPAGFAELDLRTPGQIELAYFGLFPQFIGQGLGKYLLSWALDRAWSHRPKRVWVHTCDLDHAAALPNYLRAGFAIYDERVIDQVIVRH